MDYLNQFKLFPPQNPVVVSDLKRNKCANQSYSHHRSVLFPMSHKRFFFLNINLQKKKGYEKISVEMVEKIFIRLNVLYIFYHSEKFCGWKKLDLDSKQKVAAN